MGTRIELDLAPELGISSDGVTVRTVTSSTSTLSIKEDGLYVSARPGRDGEGGTGYDDYYTSEGVRLGYKDPYTTITSQRRVTGTFYVHRLFDATLSEDDPPVLTPSNFRPEIDLVLAGDMCRVDQGDGTFKYYLVTGTNNNAITLYEELGVW